MKLNKPKFWDVKYSLISFLLIPFTLIVLIIIFLKKKITREIKFNIPIICVGNIYLGGTGKTPTAIYVANALKNMGKNPVILRKFYKNHIDEHKLIKNSFNNLILCKNRVDGIREAEKANFNVVVLDDGFQDYKINKDLNILCFNQLQLVGNGLVLPSGPLRENLNSINLANIVIINGNRDINFEKKILKINNDLEIFYSNYRPINMEQFKGNKLLAIAGIGNPNNFFDLLKKNNLLVEKKMIFPDHYEFTEIEINNIIEESVSKNYQIIMTEKDYFKVKSFNYNKIKFLKVVLEIKNKDKLIKKICEIYD